MPRKSTISVLLYFSFQKQKSDFLIRHGENLVAWPKTVLDFYVGKKKYKQEYFYLTFFPQISQTEKKYHFYNLYSNYKELLLNA